MEQIIDQSVRDHRIFDLSKSLTGIQKTTIGIFKPFKMQHYELVVEKSDHTIRTLHIGSFFGLQDSFYPTELGVFYALPTGYETMHDLLQEPFEFKKWVDDIYKSTKVGA